MFKQKIETIKKKKKPIKVKPFSFDKSKPKTKQTSNIFEIEKNEIGTESKPGPVEKPKVSQKVILIKKSQKN
jgi:hypothetical protein